MASLDTDLKNEKASVLISGVDKYRQMLNNLLNTSVNSRWFSIFGLNTEDSVFETFTDDDVSFDLLVRIDNAVKVWIPEIVLNLSLSDITVDVNQHQYNATLVFEYDNNTYSEVVTFNEGAI